MLLLPEQASAQLTFRTVALSNTPAPEVMPGVTFGGNFSIPILNEAGQVAFLDRLSGSVPGLINSANDGAIFSEANAGLRLVVQEGAPVPGDASGMNFSTLGEPSLNDLGQTAFESLLTGTGVNTLNNGGLFSEGGGQLALIARERGFAPGVNADTEFSFLATRC